MIDLMVDLWYKNAIVYCLDVETFMDANGDGIGDFSGLTQRLDYLNGIGINCIWLLPFYPTPNRDNGYDVIDYYNVDHRLGTLGDFVEFSRQARGRGIKVVVDLVVNHTSNQHPWFQQARQDRNSKYRNFYVWSDERPADASDEVIFPGVQESIWTYDEQAESYYLHRFYAHQPDLNIANPAVREEIAKIMGFWLELGVAGFRIDAAPFLIELKGIEDQAEVADRHAYLQGLREFLSWRRGDAILLAEANVSTDLIPEYFGDGNRMHMLFNFIGNQRMFLALARQSAEPLIQGMQSLPRIPHTGQWANFTRNHDELDLGRLSDEEQQELCQAFDVPEEAWIYQRGLRRRIAPLLNGDQRRISLAYSLMFTLPGTPVLRYGQEIGMGDDLGLEERTSIRTAMQWSDEPNGGFSTVPAEELVRPVLSGGQYGFEQINVARQQRDPGSLLNTVERMIRTRKNCPEFGWGDWEIINTNLPQVFAHRCEWRGGVVVAIHNLAAEACTVTLDVNAEESRHLCDLFGDRLYEPFSDGAHRISLEGYGYRWFRLLHERCDST